MSDRNTQLMKAMGSKTGRYDPEPPDHWRWYLKNGAIPHDRAVAWVKSKTVALGHHSPYAVDEHGKPLYIQHAALDLGWTLKNAQNVFYEVNKLGRIRLHREARRIYLNAEFETEIAENTGVEWNQVGRTKGEEFTLYARHISPHLIEFFKSLPKDKRDAAVREYTSFLEWKNKSLSDVVAAHRAIVDPIEDTILERHGLEKKRLPKRRPPADGVIQLTLMEVPEFVQTAGANGLYKPENGSVQTENGERTNGASLLTSDPDPDKYSSSSEAVVHRARATTTQTPLKAENPETQPLTEELGFDAKAANHLIERCRAVDPGITVAQIVHLGRLKVSQLREKLISGEIKNSIGFLLEAIPNMIKPPPRPRTRTAGAD